MTDYAIDLPVDLNSEDASGLPWASLDEARDPASITPGAWILVGSGTARAGAQVADVDGDIVHVRPLPGSVSRHHHLLGHALT